MDEAAGGQKSHRDSGHPHKVTTWPHEDQPLSMYTKTASKYNYNFQDPDKHRQTLGRYRVLIFRDL
jgi:hypothetical protein